jgi:hypothetical protein
MIGVSATKARSSSAMDENFCLSFRNALERPDCLGFFRHVALGVEIDVKGFTRGQMIEQFNGPNFHQAVAFGGTKTGRFRIEYNFTQRFAS